MSEEETPLVQALRARVLELEREQVDLQRQIAELRAAVAALLGPSSAGQSQNHIQIETE